MSTVSSSARSENRVGSGPATLASFPLCVPSLRGGSGKRVGSFGLETRLHASHAAAEPSATPRAKVSPTHRTNPRITSGRRLPRRRARIKTTVEAVNAIGIATSKTP